MSRFLRTGVALPLALLSACSTTTVVLKREAHVAQFKVTSEPPGATIFVDGTPRGKTPAAVAVRHHTVHRRTDSGEYKNGWWMFISGVAALAGGVGLTAWGATTVGDADSGGAGGVIGLSTGPIISLYGLSGLIGGIYYLAKFKKSRFSVEPDRRQLQVGVHFPGHGLFRARLTMRGARDATPEFDRVKELHYALNRGLWAAPDLPPSLRLVDTSGHQAAARIPAAPGPTRPPEAPAQPAAPDPVEKLRNRGEACYRQRDYRCALQHFERAFAARPAPAMRFNIASALDKLDQHVSAVQQYRRYLAEAGDNASPSALAHIQRRMTKLLALVGQIQLSVTPADAVVTVDGLPISHLKATRVGQTWQIVVRPATPLRIDLWQRGYRKRSLRVQLQAGEVKTVQATLKRDAGAPP